MKCVKLGDVVERVEDSVAKARVSAGWAYVKKEVWKKAHPGRPVVKPREKPVLVDKKARWKKEEKAKRVEKTGPADEVH